MLTNIDIFLLAAPLIALADALISLYVHLANLRHHDEQKNLLNDGVATIVATTVNVTKPDSKSDISLSSD